MPFLIGILEKIFTNPKTVGYIIVVGSTIMSKKFNKNTMQEVDINTSNINHDAEPLHLPRGSVRAVITLALTALVIASFIFKDKIELPEEILLMWFGAIGYYIGFRAPKDKVKEIKV